MVISEQILNGILHLFALLTSCHDDKGRARARQMVIAYLGEYLGIVNKEPYIGLFEGFLDFYDTAPDPDGLLKKTAQICGNLKGHVPRTEQYVVLLRFLELARFSRQTFDSQLVFLAEAVGRTFDMEKSICRDILAFLYQSDDPARLGPNHLVVFTAGDPPARPGGDIQCRQLEVDHFRGQAVVLYIRDIDTLFITSVRASALTLNGVALQPGAVYLIPTGAVLRDSRANPVYFSDISESFTPRRNQTSLRFAAHHADFRFPGSDNGLHDFCFEAKGGQMIGVMGGSGVGKSTLINILNGTMPPRSGRILVNGRDLYQDRKTLEGIIGFVPQDDLLFDELTVFQNLYYAGRLCLNHLDKTALTERVTRLLSELNQLETRDLVVGSPLEKTISGGQRKRLNISLELIREPAVLFVDEPTSGLSSADSANVVSLLKEQSKQGKLVIVIIHQPSSDIFKQFDSLWILDKGGRPIYTGNPIDALIYFRRAVWQAGTDECLCPQCGNVNPEQIFEIIDTPALDEKGYSTGQRRFSPPDWHQRHLLERKTVPDQASGSFQPGPSPAKALDRPGCLGQMAVFFKRTFLARLSNRQYLAVNLLIAPFLAWVIGSISRYETAQGYLFSENHNIPVYFFMSIIVAVFMGLSVSAEEIIRDRKILSRERFLHLSWFSYINAKAGYLCLVSAIQTALYVLVGNGLLEIPDFGFQLWLILFSCAVCASMIGLNISAAFKTVVTIYILIPLLLVPQIILGGMVIAFDDLIDPDTPHNRVPVIGNLMPSRWGFEAAAVAQFTSNRIQAPFNRVDQTVNHLDYVTNYYIPELRSQMDIPFLAPSSPGHTEKSESALHLLANEFAFLTATYPKQVPPFHSEGFEPVDYSRNFAADLNSALSALSSELRQQRQSAYEERQAILTDLMDRIGRDEYLGLEKQHRNKSLSDLVRNRDNLNDYRVAGNRIVRLSDPVFTRSQTPWGTAPVFSAYKQIGAWQIPTFQFNLLVLWLFSCLLYVVLYIQLPAWTARRIAAVMGRYRR